FSPFSFSFDSFFISARRGTSSFFGLVDFFLSLFSFFQSSLLFSITIGFDFFSAFLTPSSFFNFFSSFAGVASSFGLYLFPL
ncbi:hypothetical protein PFISCL1PPCAC_16469, partial [Pristionchus fissidentatus]